VIAVSPALLLAMALAAASAAVYGLLVRAAWLLLPLCWVLGVLAFVAGQALGAVSGGTLLEIGQLHAGYGLLLDALALLGLHWTVVWYNRRR
jgi:hypothetical protein